MSRKTRRQLLVRIGCAGAAGFTGCLGGGGGKQSGQQEGPGSEDEPGNRSEGSPGNEPQKGPGGEEGGTEPQEGPQEGPKSPPEEGPQEGTTEEPSAEVDTEAVGAVVRRFYEGVLSNDTDKVGAALHENSTESPNPERLESIAQGASIKSVETNVVEVNESGDRIVVEATVAAESGGYSRNRTDRVELRREDGNWKVWEGMG